MVLGTRSTSSGTQGRKEKPFAPLRLCVDKHLVTDGFLKCNGAIIPDDGAKGKKLRET
jgi:hypothetical protein